MASKNKNSHKAKDAKNNAFYLLSNLKLNNFKFDNSESIGVSETSEFIEGGTF